MRKWESAYTYHEGRTNRYGRRIPDQYDMLDGRMRTSFAMLGNTSAKGANRSNVKGRREIRQFDAWYAKLEAWRKRTP